MLSIFLSLFNIACYYLVVTIPLRQPVNYTFPYSETDANLLSAEVLVLDLMKNLSLKRHSTEGKKTKFFLPHKTTWLHDSETLLRASRRFSGSVLLRFFSCPTAVLKTILPIQHLVLSSVIR